MADETTALPQQFYLSQYQFAIEAIDSLHLPPVKSSALRGGFGHTFKRLVCQHPSTCNQACQLANNCPYGYIFETSPPKDAEALSNFSNVPRPFIIQSPADHRTHIASGEQLAFGLTLVGQGNNYLPYFIAVFRELGRIGLGRTLGNYRLASVKIKHPNAEQTDTVYRADSELIRVPDWVVTATDIEDYASNLPADRVMLDFSTPTRLKFNGRWVEHGPPFEALIQRLLGRISSLSYFHCGQPFEADFRGLIDRAADVKIVNETTKWNNWSRVSGRQKQRIEMGGLVGRVSYAGNLAPYLPLLALGQFVHVGKGTVFGNGQYRIIQP